MIKSFEHIIEKAKSTSTKIVVAAAQDTHVLKAVYEAYKEGIVDAILVGNEKEIKECLNELGISNSLFRIENVEGDLKTQCERAVELLVNDEAQAIMKGLVDTSIILKAILKEKSLRKNSLMSAVGVMDSKNYHKLLIITDAGMNIKPDLEAKKSILENAVDVAKGIGIEEPKVGVLCAKEKVDPKMEDTVHAQELKNRNINGEIKDCIVDGPFALDNIVSLEAAKIKKIESPVAGNADIVICPELVTANCLYKSMVLLGEAKSAGIIVGAKIPIIFTSRSDSEETKLNSIALAAVLGMK